MLEIRGGYKVNEIFGKYGIMIGWGEGVIRKEKGRI